MSKKYKDKLCAYCCNENSVTRDHVFPQGLFCGEKVIEYPMAPACKKCNEEKSKLEHVLLTILPFGGQHELAKRNLISEKQKRRLAKNVKLTRKIKSELIKHSSELCLPVEISILNQFVKYVVKGLSVYYWDNYLSTDVQIEVIHLTKEGIHLFCDRYSDMKVKDKININLGKETILFTGMLGIDCPKTTIWLFKIFGGLQLKDSKKPKQVSTGIFVTTELT